MVKKNFKLRWDAIDAFLDYKLRGIVGDKERGNEMSGRYDVATPSQFLFNCVRYLIKISLPATFSIKK